MPQNQRPIAVFDLDGTLADTAPDLIMALNEVLKGEGFPPLSLQKARDLIGAGARSLIMRGLHEAGYSTINETTMERMFQSFLAYYGEHLSDQTALFPGVVEALDRFKNEGWILAVCTNKFEHHSVKLLESLGIIDKFSAICGRDTFPFSKPDPRHLTFTIERAGGNIQQAIMVGDSHTDIKTARAAGIPAIMVSFGYSDIPVVELESDRLINHFDELWGATAEIVTFPQTRQID